MAALNFKAIDTAIANMKAEQQQQQIEQNQRAYLIESLEAFEALRANMAAEAKKTTLSKALEEHYQTLLDTAVLLAPVPTTDQERTTYQTNLKKWHNLHASLDHKSLKIFGGIMLTILGLALLAAAGVLTVASMGILSPAFIPVVGFIVAVFTKTTLIGAITATVAGVLGTGSLLGAGSLFGSAAHRSPIGQNAHQIEKNAYARLKSAA